MTFLPALCFAIKSTQIVQRRGKVPQVRLLVRFRQPTKCLQRLRESVLGVLQTMRVVVEPDCSVSRRSSVFGRYPVYFPISTRVNVLGTGLGRGFGFSAVGGTGSFFSVPIVKI